MAKPLSRWSLLAFLCGAFFVYNVERALLGLLAVPIQAETGVTDLQFGLLNSAVFASYAVLAPFAGLLGDRVDKARLLGVTVIAWSALTVLAGFASGFWSLLALASVAITVPQTCYAPAANALIAATHRETRTVALGCHQSAYYAGWFASGGIVAGVVALFGTWRAAFWTCGAAGLALGTAFLVFGARRVPAAATGGGAGAPSLRRGLRAFFGCPSALLAGAGYVAVVFAACGYGAWAPKFVALKFSLSPEKAGAGALFAHYAAALAAIFVAAALTDACVKRRPGFRLALQAGALAAAAPLCALFGLGETLAVALGAAALFGVMRGLFEANAFASVFDVVPADCRAGAIGFLQVIAGLAGSTAPLMLGALSQRLGVRGLGLGFVVTGGVLALGATALAVSLRFTFAGDYIKEGRP